MRPHARRYASAGRDGALNELHYPVDEAAAEHMVQASEARGHVAQTDEGGEGDPSKNEGGEDRKGGDDGVSRVTGGHDACIASLVVLEIASI